MTRAQRIRRYTAIKDRYEKAFFAPLKKALKDQISSFTTVLRNQGPAAVNSVVVVDAKMAKVIETVYVRSGLASANETLSYLRRLPKVEVKRRTFGFNAEWTNEILEYFRLNLFNKVVLPISETTREYILQVISEGVDQGWSIEEMTQKIEREDYLDGRVRRILRTEINRATNYGAVMGEKKFEYKTQKEWASVHDSRTRHPHLSADQQRVALDGKFSVGGEMLEFPGDPNGSAENTINCRCVTLINAQRDEKGRLMPKDGNAKPLPKVRGRLRADLANILAELQS